MDFIKDDKYLRPLSFDPLFHFSQCSKFNFKFWTMFHFLNHSIFFETQVLLKSNWNAFNQSHLHKGGFVLTKIFDWYNFNLKNLTKLLNSIAKLKTAKLSNFSQTNKPYLKSFYSNPKSFFISHLIRSAFIHKPK